MHLAVVKIVSVRSLELHTEHLKLNSVNAYLFLERELLVKVLHEEVKGVLFGYCLQLKSIELVGMQCWFNCFYIEWHIDVLIWINIDKTFSQHDPNPVVHHSRLKGLIIMDDSLCL